MILKIVDVYLYFTETDDGYVDKWDKSGKDDIQTFEEYIFIDTISDLFFTIWIKIFSSIQTGFLVRKEEEESY